MTARVHTSVALLSLTIAIASLVVTVVNLHPLLNHHENEHEISVEQALSSSWHQFSRYNRTFEAVDSVFFKSLEESNMLAAYRFELIEIDEDGNETVVSSADHTNGISINKPYHFRISFSHSGDLVADVLYDIGKSAKNHMHHYIMASVSAFVMMLLSILMTVIFIVSNRSLGRAKRQFVNVVAHNMRNPLSIAHAASEALLESDSIMNDASCAKLANVNLKQLDELDSQIDFVLKSIRLWNIKNVGDNESVNIKSVAEECVNSFRVLNPDAVFEMDVDPSHSVYIEPEYLSTSLNILIDNSLKYCEDTPHVRISSFVGKRGEISLSVSDNGIGFSKEERRKAFKEYQRGERGIIKSARGYGLGLHYIKMMSDITKCCKVSISSKEGEGSTITLSRMKAVKS